MNKPVPRLRIEYLADRPDCVRVLANWFHDQWGYLSPERNLDDRIEQLRKQTNRTQIPVTFVAFDGDDPVGSASLVESDMDTRPDLSPWLANVYVAISHRNRGIGAKLVNRVLDEADSYGFTTIYLWTPDKKSFYEKRGWTVMETTIYRNEHATVMSSPVPRHSQK